MNPDRRETGTGGAASVSRYCQPLIRYFVRRGVAVPTAEDLAQDCFTRLFALKSIAHIENIEAYLFRTASRVFADYVAGVHRRHSGQHISLDAAGFDGGVAEIPAQDRTLAGKQEVERLKAVLREMKPRTREIFLLKRLDGLSYAQIAASLGLTNRAVEWHVTGALKLLRERLDDCPGK